jgi:hypothetical protein
LIFNENAEIIRQRKDNLFRNGAGKIGYPYGKKMNLEFYLPP